MGVDTSRPGGSEGSMFAKLTQGRKSIRAFIAGLEEEDVILAVLSRRLKTKESKKVDALRLSHEGCSNRIPPSKQDEGGQEFTDKLWQLRKWVDNALG